MRDGNGGDEEESNPARWTDEDEDELERLRTAPVTIGDTAYARFEDQMIQDAELAYEKMTPEQRAAYLSKLMEIDATWHMTTATPRPTKHQSSYIYV